MTDANYRGLQLLQERHQEQQFSVLAFPCNQFGGQEPGDRDAILAFARGKYGATFPIFDKVDVNGLNAHPVWKWLMEQKGELLGADVKWNFAKFLVGRDGKVIKRYGPPTAPEDIEKDILAALKAQPPPTRGVVTPTGAGAKAASSA